MVLSPIIVALAGFTLVLGSWVAYMATVPSGKVPAKPWGHMGTQAVGAMLGTTSVWMALGTGLGMIIPLAFGGVAATMAGLFFYLFSQRATPSGRLTVAVGQPLRPFVATTPEGTPFDSASLQGRRILLKFFRGHW